MWNKADKGKDCMVSLICGVFFKKLISEKQSWWFPGAGGWFAKWYKLSVIRWNSSENLTCSMVSIVKNTVLYTWILLRDYILSILTTGWTGWKWMKKTRYCIQIVIKKKFEAAALISNKIVLSQKLLQKTNKNIICW